MTSDIDRFIATSISEGLERVPVPDSLVSSADLARRQQRSRRRTAVVIAAGSAAVVVGLGFALSLLQGDVRPSQVPTASDSAQEAPRCSSDWADFIDLTTVGGYPTVEDAVNARAGFGYLITEVHTDADTGVTSATVRDPWGRDGVYELTHVKRGWVITGGTGCAAH